MATLDADGTSVTLHHRTDEAAVRKVRCSDLGTGQVIQILKVQLLTTEVEHVNHFMS